MWGPRRRPPSCPFSPFPARRSRSLAVALPPPPGAGSPAEFARRLTGFVPASGRQGESTAAGGDASTSNASDAAADAGAGDATALSDTLQRDGSASGAAAADAVAVRPGEGGSSLLSYLLAGTGVVTVAGAGVVAVLYFQDDRVQAAVDDAARKVRDRCVYTCQAALDRARPALERGKEGAAELFALLGKHASPLGARVVVMWHQAVDATLPYITATQAVVLKYWAELSSHIVPPPLGNPPSHNGAARSSEEEAPAVAEAEEEEEAKEEDGAAAAAAGAASEAPTSAVNTTPRRKPANGSAPPSESKDPDQADKPSPARNLATKLDGEAEAPVGEAAPSDTASA